MTMGLGKGFEVQYSDDGNEVCFIPKLFIGTEIFSFMCDYFYSEGYKWWVPADERCGYRFVKELPDGKIEAP